MSTQQTIPSTLPVRPFTAAVDDIRDDDPSVVEKRKALRGSIESLLSGDPHIWLLVSAPERGPKSAGRGWRFDFGHRLRSTLYYQHHPMLGHHPDTVAWALHHQALNFLASSMLSNYINPACPDDVDGTTQREHTAHYTCDGDRKSIRIMGARGFVVTVMLRIPAGSPGKSMGRRMRSVMTRLLDLNRTAARYDREHHLGLAPHRVASDLPNPVCIRHQDREWHNYPNLTSRLQTITFNGVESK